MSSHLFLNVKFIDSRDFRMIQAKNESHIELNWFVNRIVTKKLNELENRWKSEWEIHLNLIELNSWKFNDLLLMSWVNFIWSAIVSDNIVAMISTVLQLSALWLLFVFTTLCYHACIIISQDKIAIIGVKCDLYISLGQFSVSVALLKSNNQACSI